MLSYGAAFVITLNEPVIVRRRYVCSDTNAGLMGPVSGRIEVAENKQAL